MIMVVLVVVAARDDFFASWSHQDRVFILGSEAAFHVTEWRVSIDNTCVDKLLAKLVKSG